MAQSAIPVRGTSQLHLGWLGLGVLLVVVALLAGLVGYAVAQNVTPANPDQALVDDLSAAWSSPYDAAAFAALYAPDATFHDMLANETSTGLEAIQAKASAYAAADFITTATSTPTRQGDYVAVFEKHGSGGQTAEAGLLVMQMQDGKVLNQWVYPAP